MFLYKNLHGLKTTVPSQTMTPHDYQGPTATMPGTTTVNNRSTLTYTHSMQPPHPTFCKYKYSRLI